MKKKREILVFRDTGAMADHILGVWTDICGEAIKRRGQFCVALSGGKTPVPLYNKLSLTPYLPWNKTHLFLVDERIVPYDHGESNFGMIRRMLLGSIPLPEENIHPIPADDAAPSDAAVAYESKLSAFFNLVRNEVPAFDLMLLGMGADGHTASLFPGADALKEYSRLACAVIPYDRDLMPRVTLTFPVINNSSHIIFFISGRSKARIVREVLERNNPSLPAAMVRPVSGRLLFILDDDAGALLSKEE